MKNRENMYVSDDKATSIAHRMIDENLPKFVDNINVFEKIATSDVAKDFGSLYSNMEAYLNVLSIDEIFRMDYFYMVLTQKQIDVYNAIVGELNKLTNLYNQQQKNKTDRLPKLKTLFKQILSERNSLSWLPNEFENDTEMLRSIESYYQELKSIVLEGEQSLQVLLCNISDYDLEHIYLSNDLQLTNISQKHYGDWAYIRKAIEKEFPKRDNETEDKYSKRLKDTVLSIATINNLMKKLFDEYEDGTYKPIETFFVSKGAEDNESEQKPNLFIRIENAYTEVEPLLSSPYPTNKRLAQDKANVERIKKLLDAIKDLQHFVKPLLGNGAEGEKDNRFYGEFIPLWETLDQITPLYNMVRNRLTKKLCSDEKIKLFFENNGMFLSGWTDSQTESDNGTQFL